MSVYSDSRKLERLIGYDAYHGTERETDYYPSREPSQIENLVEGVDYKILGTETINLDTGEITFEKKP